jgi:hypothetical protein
MQTVMPRLSPGSPMPSASMDIDVLPPLLHLRSKVFQALSVSWLWKPNRPKPSTTPPGHRASR